MNKKHLNNYIEILPEIKDALRDNRPVVALESTIISHGMPYPDNIKTAKRLEGIVRENGAVPATIAIINGVIKIGLTERDLTQIGEGPGVQKVSRRDIPLIVTQKGSGATTVASTIVIAAMSNIKVFATGGIGGVHRDGQVTFDISADLPEIARTDIAVVSAGVKSILDIGLTLEYLETQGVPVVGFKVKEFPAFYTRKSGFEADCKVDSEVELAHIIKTKWDMGIKGGVLIANPVPKDFEMDSSTIDNAIEAALREARSKNMTGKEITPFLLAKLNEITAGKSLKTNIELVCNNAKIASRVAVELFKISEE